MKLSTKGRYGLRAVFDLAQHYGKGPVPLREVAERQGLSEQYLEQLFLGLRKHGLVKSIRGLRGGYTLSRPPGEITVGNIVRALEGPIAPVECVSEEDPEDCVRADHCVARLVWTRLRDAITDVLDSITLEDMCKTAKERDVTGYMYYI
ncbi:MAG: Rrf2 family transcriptional regulator [Clostridia bacterium]|nr:Rrf2 family transcriptional regulator [Clostridia bacterium]